MSDPIVSFADVAACEEWFERNHESVPAFMCKISKGKYAGETLGYQDVLTIALCFGWIDSVKRGFDDRYFLQRFTPRKKGSVWSQVNRDKVLALIDAGRMRPAGMAAIEEAKASGRWDAAYTNSKDMVVPDDLAAALAADPEAAAFFETLTKANRFAIVFRVTTAKKPETRAARIEKYVGMCHRHEKIH